MKTARQYHLSFIVREIQNWGGAKKPCVVTDANSGELSKFYPVASFITPCGVKMIDEVTYDIERLDPFNSTVSNYAIWGGDEDESIEIVSPPPHVLCYSSYEVAVPLQDFLDILKEWKDFLNSLPYEHTLSEK